MKKVENFYRALENLKTIYNYEKPYEDVVLTGMVTYYSLCFEQAKEKFCEMFCELGEEMKNNWV